MKTCRLIILPALFFIFAQQLHAQVKVEMGLERRLYVLYEPIPITVVITNLSGHDLDLTDADSQKWFSFEVTSEDPNGEERIVPPVDINYKMPGLRIPAGATVKHIAYLSSMYAVQDVGLYRFRASVYVPEAKKYFSSAKEEIEVTDGKLFWQETVGIPNGSDAKGTHRTISLLTFRQPKSNVLYVRVEDKDAGTIYITGQLGPLIAAVDPDIMLDKGNMLHVLQLVSARTYIYSRVGLNGEMYDQLTYNAAGSRPVLKKDAEGEVFVSGGQLGTTAATGPGSTPAAASDNPKVSDRPPGFTSPQ